MDKTLGEVTTNLEVILELIDSIKEEENPKVRNSLLDEVKKITETSVKKIKNLKK